MNYLLLLKDGTIGFLCFAFLSVLTQKYKKNETLFNIISFIWGFPTVLMLLLYVIYKNTKSKKIIISFLNQQLFGRILGVFLIILLLYVKNQSFFIIFFTNLLVSIVVLFFYFKKKLYLNKNVTNLVI